MAHFHPGPFSASCLPVPCPESHSCSLKLKELPTFTWHPFHVATQVNLILLSPLVDIFHLHLCSLLPFHSPRLCGNGVKEERMRRMDGWVFPSPIFFRASKYLIMTCKGSLFLSFQVSMILHSNKLVSLLVCGSCGTHIEVFGHKHLLIHY